MPVTFQASTFATATSIDTGSMSLNAGTATAPGRVLLIGVGMWDPDILVPQLTAIDVNGVTPTQQYAVNRQFYIYSVTGLSGIQVVTVGFSTSATFGMAAMALLNADTSSLALATAGPGILTSATAGYSDMLIQDAVWDFAAITQGAFSVQPTVADNYQTVRQDRDFSYDAANNYTVIMSHMLNEGGVASAGYAIGAVSAGGRFTNYAAIRLNHLKVGTHPLYYQGQP